MKICHVSDNHGLFPVLDDADVVVHTGDLLPNRSRGIRVIEEGFQRNWVEERLDTFRAWIGDRPFLYCAGNHDYFDPLALFVGAGIDAICLNDRFVEVHGVGFIGFPYVKYFTGEWNFERSEAEIERLLRPIMDAPHDVFVSHGPMRGVLDRNSHGERCGSLAIRQFLQTTSPAPKLFLHGHIHEAEGTQAWSRGILVSNAATTQRVVEI